MEKYIINKDIHILCVTADSFPAGVMKAHGLLHSKISAAGNRKIVGISRPDQVGQIVYKAGAEEIFDGEAESLKCERFTIKAGTYISQFIPNFCDDVSGVVTAFKELLASPSIDPNGYCLEIYEGEKDVRCLVPLMPAEV